MTGGRVLVTGAGGFVGRSLTHGFSRLGWRVIGLDLPSRDAAGGERPEGAEGRVGGIRWVSADLAEGVPEEVPEVDLVVHAAWVTTDPETLGISTAEYLGINLRPLLAVLTYAARTRPAAFVFLSSSGVFAAGDATGGLTDEDEPTGTSPYAVAKRAGELLVRPALEPHTAAHVVRLGYLFGPGEAARPSRTRISLIGAWLAAARDGGPLAVRADNPSRDWTFAPDLAAALERIASADSAGHPIHLGSEHVWTDRAVAEHIGAAFGGSELVARPPEGELKPPMISSDVAALSGFRWTDPPSGLRAVIDSEVAA